MRREVVAALNGGMLEWVINVVSRASRALPLLPRFRTCRCVASLGDQSADARRGARPAAAAAGWPHAFVQATAAGSSGLSIPQACLSNYVGRTQRDSLP